MSWLGQIPTTMAYAMPVAFAAVGETVCQTSGIINIGLEGGMLSGAFFGMLASYSTGCPWLGVLAGALAGLLVSLIYVWFTVRLAADQVVVGTALNLLVLGVTGTLYRAQFGQSGQLLSVPRVPNWGGVDPLMILLVVSVPLVWFLLNRTAWGLAARGVGEYPSAVEAVGWSPTRIRTTAVAFGGLYAGLAGAYLSLVLAGSFAENMTAGRGFVAIAVVTFGRWRAGWVFAAALLIGFVDSLQFQFQAMGMHLPFQLFIALPYLVALVVLVVVGNGTSGPTALGRAFRSDR